MLGGKAAAAAEEEEEKMLRLAPIKAGGGRRRVFCLRLAPAVTDGCVCAHVSVCCRGAHPSAFPGDAGGHGRRLLWLVKSSPLY